MVFGPEPAPLRPGTGPSTANRLHTTLSRLLVETVIVFARHGQTPGRFSRWCLRPQACNKGLLIRCSPFSEWHSRRKCQLRKVGFRAQTCGILAGNSTDASEMTTSVEVLQP